jgi:hypothetical protein
VSWNWHKRHAMVLAGQLPENASDARAVIRALQDIVDYWLHAEPAAPPSKVIARVRDEE